MMGKLTFHVKLVTYLFFHFEIVFTPNESGDSVPPADHSIPLRLFVLRNIMPHYV